MIITVLVIREKSVKQVSMGPNYPRYLSRTSRTMTNLIGSRLKARLWPLKNFKSHILYRFFYSNRYRFLLVLHAKVHDWWLPSPSILISYQLSQVRAVSSERIFNNSWFWGRLWWWRIFENFRVLLGISVFGQHVNGYRSYTT